MASGSANENSEDRRAADQVTVSPISATDQGAFDVGYASDSGKSGCRLSSEADQRGVVTVIDPHLTRNCRKEGGVARQRFEAHIWEMVLRIDPCLDTLRRLIAAGDTKGIPLAQRAIAEYWEGTPPRARKSGLLYMQHILHERRDALDR